MYDNKCKIEAGSVNCEVITIDGCVASIFLQTIPACAVDDDFVDVVFLVVEIFIHLVSTIDGNVMFAGKASHYQGYVLFVHCC